MDGEHQKDGGRVENRRLTDLDFRNRTPYKRTEDRIRVEELSITA